MAGPTLRAPIPAEEPRLRIGIILPEDRRQSVAVDLQDPGWQVADAGPPREASGPLVFAREGATVALCLGGTEVGRAEQ
ncbi:MAG TPA: hypothetical protein VFK86_16675, partial [Bauldia sp.]|nr:hypothetical protein [Bauldia sp.]